MMEALGKVLGVLVAVRIAETRKSNFESIMEFHASGYADGAVDIMACTDTMCRQMKIAITPAEETKYGTDKIQAVVCEKLTAMLAEKGEEETLKVTTLSQIA